MIGKGGAREYFSRTTYFSLSTEKWNVKPNIEKHGTFRSISKKYKTSAAQKEIKILLCKTMQNIFASLIKTKGRLMMCYVENETNWIFIQMYFKLAVLKIPNTVKNWEVESHYALNLMQFMVQQNKRLAICCILLLHTFLLVYRNIKCFSRSKITAWIKVLKIKTDFCSLQAYLNYFLEDTELNSRFWKYIFVIKNYTKIV